MTLEQFDDMTTSVKEGAAAAVSRAHNQYAALKHQQKELDKAIAVLKQELDGLAHEPELHLYVTDSSVSDSMAPVEVKLYLSNTDITVITPQLIVVLESRQRAITKELNEMDETWQSRYKDVTGLWY